MSQWEYTKSTPPPSVSGKVFVLSGDFSSDNKEGPQLKKDYEKLLQDRGATVNKKVTQGFKGTKKTGYLIVGKKSRSSKGNKSNKIKDAEKWQIPIIDLNDLRLLLDLD